MSIPNNLRVTPLRIAGGLIIAGALGLGAIVGATEAFGGVGGDASATLSVPITPQLIQRGAYVAVEGDCAACHTAPAGQPFAGGVPIATPIGTVFTTNITPDKTTGIGAYTYGDFERAVRRGIRPDGDALYPAMPYPSYAHVSDADMQALYAYFTHSVQPRDDAELARGPSLVEGPEHCAPCHTDRGFGLQELALTPQDGPQYLAG